MPEIEMDDEWEYDGYRMGRATNSAEVRAGDGTRMIEEGTIVFDPINREDHWMWEEDSWVNHYVAPDGGVGFGIGEGNSGGAVVRRELVDIIEFPEPMTEKEAWEWLDENPEMWRKHLDEEIQSDTTAADLLGGDLR
ncbi:MAG: hypothetical protein ACOCTH_01740 [Halodesulfurarchaeum sp.]